MTRASVSDTTGSARESASRLLAQAAEQFPQVQPASLEFAHLTREDRQLARAIYRITMQRWLTIDAVLNHYLQKTLAQLEPAMQGVLRAATTQLLFMQRLPAYAVVDESVALARQLVRPKAAGMANAILRKVARLPAHFDPAEPWTLSELRLPLDGGTLYLNQPVLPDPAQIVDHLAAATSHPRRLVRRWIEQFDESVATRLCLHGLTHPPLIVAVEKGFDMALHADIGRPHEREGFIFWQGGHDALKDFLAHHPARRVQDPASSLAGISTASLCLKTILDLCAGRGTKTRQLAVMHPQAEIVATDTDTWRLADLRSSLAGFDHVHAVEPEALGDKQFDLILLDVPCSNTGVLGRRSEARYRFTEKQINSLVELQKQIIARSLAMIEPGGHVLYSTCSIERDEDQGQTRQLVAQTGGQIVHEHLALPSDSDDGFHDGSYHALVRVPG